MCETGIEAGHRTDSGEGSVMINEFKAFILRGNVLDLAVAVVIGAAFGAIVNSLVENIIMPLIGGIRRSARFFGAHIRDQSERVAVRCVPHLAHCVPDYRPRRFRLHHQADECADGQGFAPRGRGRAGDLPGVLQRDFPRREPVPELHDMAPRSERLRS